MIKQHSDTTASDAKVVCTATCVLSPSEKYLALHIYKWHPLAKGTREGKTWLVRTYPEMRDYGWYWGSRTFYRGLKRLAVEGFIEVQWHPHPFAYGRGHCTWIFPTDKMSTLVEQIEPAAMARSKSRRRSNQSGQKVQINKQVLSLDSKDSSVASSKKEDSSKENIAKQEKIEEEGIIPKEVILRECDFPDWKAFHKARMAQHWGVNPSEIKCIWED